MVVGGDNVSNSELSQSQQTTPDWFSELGKTPFQIKNRGDLANLHYVSIETGENRATPQNASASYYSFLTNPVHTGYTPTRVDGLKATDYSLTATLKRAQTPTVVA
jgi:hypothetical protein